MISHKTSDRSHSVSVRVLWFVGVCAALTLGACGAAGSAQEQAGGGPSSPAASGVTLTFLAALAKSSAADGGDPNVTSADAVLTTEQGASLFMGLLDNPSEPVYLVQTKGHFTLKDYSGPPDSQAPTGSYDILMVDASSGQVLSAGVTHAASDLSSLGTVITLQL